MLHQEKEEKDFSLTMKFTKEYDLKVDGWSSAADVHSTIYLKCDSAKFNSRWKKF